MTSHIPPFGVDFTNVLQASFMCAHSKSAKKTLLTWLYFSAFLGSGYVKAAHKMLMKLTPDLRQLLHSFSREIPNTNFDPILRILNNSFLLKSTFHNCFFSTQGEQNWIYSCQISEAFVLTGVFVLNGLK